MPQMVTDDSMSATPKYLIGRVTKLTGLSIDVVRVWERRYAAVRPVRSSGGTRLYSDADIRRLRRLRKAVECGYSIGQASKLSELELDDLIAGASQSPDLSDPYKSIRERFLDAVRSMDVINADQELARAATLFPIGALVKKVVSPAFEEIRASRSRKELGFAHEKLAYGVANRILGTLFRVCAPSVKAETILLATPAGERDELGLLLSALLAAAQGWHVIYLGTDLPADEIVLAARTTNARVLMLNLTTPLPGIAGDLADISRLAPLATRIWIAGAAAEHYKKLTSRANWIFLRNLEELDEYLITVGVGG
jgi:MerR family transcriptional regulator, light-induced transcriptional regulator